MAEATAVQEPIVEKLPPQPVKDRQDDPVTPEGGATAKGAKERVGFIRRWIADSKREGFLQASGLKRRADVLVAQATAVEQQLEHLAPEVPESEEDSLRVEIGKTEAKLGIETSAQRALEASLFIDPAFMRVLELRGDEHPEEAFGTAAWKGWVEARQMGREIGERSLTMEDLQQLHSTITQGLLEDSWRGALRQYPIYQDYFTNGEGKGRSMAFSPEEVAAIEQNPLLKLYFTDDTRTKGYFEYPTTTDPEFYDSILASFTPAERAGILADPDPEKERSLVRGLMGRFVAKYNEPIPKTREAIIAKAASLQKELVGIHAYGDGNGRFSKLLMNMYLEKAGLNPSILENSDRDLYYTPEAWEQEVANGQTQYASLKEKSELHPDSQREVFFDQGFLDVYDQVIAPYTEPPPPLDALNLRVMDKYRKFLEQATELHGKFKTFVDQRQLTGINNPAVDSLGGLIPAEYIALWGDTRPEVQERVRSEFYHPVEVYRGVPTEQVTEPRDLLTLFTQVPAEGAAYRTLKRWHETASPAETVRETLLTYNHVLASDFFTREVPDVTADPHGLAASEQALVASVVTAADAEKAARAMEAGSYLSYLIEGHKGIGGTRENPIYPVSVNVSTAQERSTSEYYMGGKRTKYHAVMITSLLPKHGTYYDATLSTVPVIDSGTLDVSRTGLRTFYTPGGIDPNAINAVTFFDQQRNPTGIAKREGNTITLIDGKNEMVERYVFDSEGKLRLSERRVLSDDDRRALQKERVQDD